MQILHGLWIITEYFTSRCVMKPWSQISTMAKEHDQVLAHGVGIFFKRCQITFYILHHSWALRWREYFQPLRKPVPIHFTCSIPLLLVPWLLASIMYQHQCFDLIFRNDTSSASEGLLMCNIGQKGTKSSIWWSARYICFSVTDQYFSICMLVFKVLYTRKGGGNKITHLSNQCVLLVPVGRAGTRIPMDISQLCTYNGIVPRYTRISLE